MPGKVHQFFRFEESWLDEIFLIRPHAISFICHQFRLKQINPLAISRCRNTVWTTSVPGEQSSIGGDVEMTRPLTAFKVIPDSLSARDVVTSKPKHLALRRLQVVPDHLAVATEKLVAFDFHIHRTTVNLSQCRAVSANRPGSINFVPRPLMTKHQQRWISRRKLNVVVPVSAFEERFH